MQTRLAGCSAAVLFYEVLRTLLRLPPNPLPPPVAEPESENQQTNRPSRAAAGSL